MLLFCLNTSLSTNSNFVIFNRPYLTIQSKAITDFPAITTSLLCSALIRYHSHTHTTYANQDALILLLYLLTHQLNSIIDYLRKYKKLNWFFFLSLLFLNVLYAACVGLLSVLYLLAQSFHLIIDRSVCYIMSQNIVLPRTSIHIQ